MEKEFFTQTNSQFNSLNYNKDSDSWTFEFADKISINVTSIWRLLVGKQIKLVSLDNGHQFGLPKPVDLIYEMTEILTGKYLLEIKVKQFTGDLLLTLTDNLQIEIFITSSGFESYKFSIENRNYIGMGSGDLEFYDN